MRHIFFKHFLDFFKTLLFRGSRTHSRVVYLITVIYNIWQDAGIRTRCATYELHTSLSYTAHPNATHIRKYKTGHFSSYLCFLLLFFV